MLYKNSKPTAGVVIKDGQKVLVAKRNIDPMKGTYDLVGGFLENGEHPEVGAVREAKEETGLDIKIVSLLGIYIDTYDKDEYTLNIIYVADVVKGKILASNDVDSLQWVDVNDKIKFGFKNSQMAFNDYKRLYRTKYENTYK